jgi:hypothetical protein
MVKFSGVIYKLGINPVVDPPDEILDELFAEAKRTKGPIPVSGMLNGTDFVQTLVKYAGKWRLYINGEMLKRSGLAVGEKAFVELEFDPRSRDVPMPARLAKALRKNKFAAVEFERLPPSRKKEVCRYLESLKTVESVDKNISRFLSHLLGEKTDAQHGLMRRKKAGNKSNMPPLGGR